MNNILFDKRTKEQTKADYDIWLEMERRIVEYLRKYNQIYYNPDKDHWLSPTRYCPDCIIIERGRLIPIEVKYTKYDLNEVHWKLNQYRSLRSIKWYLLLVAKKRFTVIPRYQEWEEIESWYCNKPCMKYTDVKRRNIEDLQYLNLLTI